MRWLEAYSSHRVGVGSVSAVCPRAGGISDRPSHEIIGVVVGVVAAGVAILLVVTAYVLLFFLLLMLLLLVLLME